MLTQDFLCFAYDSSGARISAFVITGPDLPSALSSASSSLSNPSLCDLHISRIRLTPAAKPAEARRLDLRTVLT